MEALFEDKFQDQYYKGRKPPGHSKKYYVIFELGQEVAIFDTWEDTDVRVKGFKGAKHRAFKTYREAELALKHHIGYKETDIDKS